MMPNPKWLVYILIAGIAALASWTAQSWRYQAQIEAQNAAWGKERTALFQAHAQAIEQLREQEQKLQMEIEHVRQDYQAQIDANARAVVDARRAVKRLREQLATNSHYSSSDPTHSRPALDDTARYAARLQHMVGVCAERYTELASIADQYRASLIGLQGWAQAISAPKLAQM